MTHLPVTVLHLRPSNFVGGPERQILRYCAGGVPAAYRQIVATFTPSGPGESGEGHALLRAARAAGIDAFALPGGWRSAAVAALDRLVREQDVRLICAHGYRADLLGSWIGRRRGIPVAWFLRGWTGEDRRVRAYEGLDRALLGWADRLVCLSQTQADALPRRISRDRISIVVNAIAAPAVDAAAARAALLRRLAIPAGGDDCLLIAIAGRLSPEKGAHDFLLAAARVRERLPHARFLVFGDGPLRQWLAAEAVNLGLSTQTHFAGHVPEWPRLLPGIDLFVNPSLREQAPNVVLEAMAASVPILATNVGAVAEIAGAAEGDAAMRLVPPRNPGLLAAAMLALAEDAPQRASLAQQGHLRVQQAYSPARQQCQLQSVFRDLIAPPDAAETRWQVASPADAAGLPGVSVVLPVRHEARHLGALLEQLLDQDYPPERFEVLVADGGARESDDGTTALAQDYARRFPGRVRWLANPGRRSSAGRNVGIAAARGEWIVFVDGHCVLPGSGWLRASMSAARSNGALCLSRPQPLTADLRPGWTNLIAHVRATRIGHGADSTIYDADVRGWVNPSSSGAAYHRTLFERVGVYDENFDACEDVEFNHRVAAAGVRAWLAPEAAVYYAARASLSGLWRQMVRYGRGRVRLARKHRAARSLAQAVPALWLAGMLAACILILAGHGLWRALGLVAPLSYVALVGAYSTALARRHGWRFLFGAPAVFFTVHAGLGAGAWREMLAGARHPAPATLARETFASRSQS